MLDAHPILDHTGGMKSTPTLVWATDLVAGQDILAAIRHRVVAVTDAGTHVLVETIDCLARPDVLIFPADQLVELVPLTRSPHES